MANEGIPSISSSPISSRLTTETTIPETLLRHNISDEELVMISEPRLERWWEVMWFSLGVALAQSPRSIQSIAEAFGDAANGDTPISILELFGIAVCVIGFTSAVVISLMMRKRSSTATAIVNKIREREHRQKETL